MHDLNRYDFPELVVDAARSRDVDPSSVVLEITESQIMAEVTKPLEILSRLRLKGVGLAIDDYGTGASSMQQPKRIHFTELKINRVFVAGAPEDNASSKKARDGNLCVTTSRSRCQNILERKKQR